MTALVGYTSSFVSAFYAPYYYLVDTGVEALIADASFSARDPRSASSNRSSAISTIITYGDSRSEPDARWMRSESCLPGCTTYKRCKARSHEAHGKDGSGRVSSNKVLPPPRPTIQWSRQMIAFRSNNAASAPITAFARFGENAGGHFLHTRLALERCCH